jgi:hypothetical protein
VLSDRFTLTALSSGLLWREGLAHPTVSERCDGVVLGFLLRTNGKVAYRRACTKLAQDVGMDARSHDFRETVNAAEEGS